MKLIFGVPMDIDNKTFKPVYTSVLAANEQADKWTAQQNISSISDNDGTKWRVEAIAEEGFESEISENYIYTVSLMMRTTMSSKELIECGILDAVDDERLVQLIGDHQLDMEMCPIRFKDKVENNAKRAAREYLVTLRDKLAEKSLLDLKRGLVIDWIEKNSLFGAKNHKPLVARL